MEEYLGTRIDFSRAMKLPIPVIATMTCLESTEYAALERTGIPLVYQFVMVSLFPIDDRHR